VAKVARRQATSPRQRAINKRAIRQLRSVSETCSGTDLAKEARALERALEHVPPKLNRWGSMGFTGRSG
jgi:hypothetical protein